MQILNVHIQNFLSVEEINLRLANLGIVLIEGENRDSGGSNGAGKSAIIDAIRWCLFGTLSRDLKGDDVVRLDQQRKPVKNCRVIVDIDVDGHHVQVVRHRKHHQYANKMLLFVDGKEITMGGDRETQDKFEKLVQIDCDSFISAVMFPQGASGFPSLSDAEQKAIFDKLLGTKRFAEAQDRIKAKNKKLQAGLQSIRATRSAKYQQIKQLQDNVENLTRQQAAFAEQKAANILQAQQQVSHLETLPPPVDSTIDAQVVTLREQVAAHRLQEKYSQLQTKQSAYTNNDKQLAAEQAKLDLLRKQAANAGPEPVKPEITREECSSLYETAKREVFLSGSLLQECSEAIKNFEKNARIQQTKFCSKCGMEMDAAARARLMGSVELDIESARGRIAVLLTRREAAADSLQKIMPFETAWQEYVHWEYQSTCRYEIPQLENTVSNLTTLLAQCRAEFEASANDYRVSYEAAAVLTKQLEDFGRQKQSEQHAYSTWQMQLANARIQLQQAQAATSPYESLVVKARNDLAAVNASIGISEIVEAKLAEDVQYLEFWTEGFGNSGVKSLLLDTIAPYLSYRASTYLEALTGGTASVEFCTQTKLRSGESRDKFEVKVSYQFGGGQYGGVSGGEKRRVDLCCLLALGDLGSSRSFAPIALKILDEPFEGLDASGAEQVISLLKTHVVPTCKTVLLVTHDDNLKSLIDNRITVIKEGGISRLLSA